MKSIILLLLVCANVLYCQDSEPSAWEFVWGHSSLPRVFDPDSTKQTTIITGFQWSGSKKMNEAMKNNSRAGGTYKSGTGLDDSPLQLYATVSFSCLFTLKSVKSHNPLHQ